MIRFGEDVCRNVDSALRREWLRDERDWRVCLGNNQRMQYTPVPRLLVAATKPPVGRWVGHFGGGQWRSAILLLSSGVAKWGQRTGNRVFRTREVRCIRFC
jgi:hypothetical protein